MGLLQQRLGDPNVLIRLNAFILSYFGWVAFGVLYGVIGRWSVDLTGQFLRLPLTSRELVMGLVNFTKSVPPLYALFNTVYYLGFAGSIALIVAYLLLYLHDLESSDQLLARYLMAYAVAGSLSLVFHVYAPHIVYNLPGYTSGNTLLTRQEFVLPSLHNTFATINIITLWRYRRKLGGKALIFINTLIPFATVFLGHHWAYDILTGILLGIAVSRVSRGWSARISEEIYRLEVSSLQRLTIFNVLLALIVLVIAANPRMAVEVFGGILEAP
jgi:membrane-associated phospholipid phosphatase